MQMGGGATSAAITAEELTKGFGKIRALEGVSIEVPRGTVTALLGPNGAGKTTFVRILATLLRPDSGRATVAGHDVVHEAGAVRAVIGLTGQYTAVDENLTGRENLEMVARLYHLGRAEARARADELLAQFDLTDAAARRAKTYSGGMRRRLDLAASLVARPPILFLDEPTTGLDPRSRLGMWDIITTLVKEGTTVLLTTQNLDEADRLADAIAVLDRGRIIKAGTSLELKGCCGGDAFVQVRIAERSQTEAAAALLGDLGNGRMTASAEIGDVSLPATEGAALLPEIIRRLDGSGIAIADISLRQPTLDDVFLALTGHSTEEAEGNGATAEGGAPAGRKGGMA